MVELLLKHRWIGNPAVVVAPFHVSNPRFGPFTELVLDSGEHQCRTPRLVQFSGSHGHEEGANRFEPRIFRSQKRDTAQ
jgi:hypothetical protein